MHKVDLKQDPADGAEAQTGHPAAVAGQPLIVDRQIVADSWQRIVGDEIPAAGAIIVTLPVWLAQRETLRQRAEPVGVWLEPADEVEQLADDVAQLPLIAVNFPVFTDGRGFSSGRLLRERFGFRGELRATGDVFKDTMFYLKRCGFNAFAVRADKDIAEAMRGLDDFSETYQAAVDQPVPLFRRR